MNKTESWIYVKCPIDGIIQRMRADTYAFICEACNATIFQNKDNWRQVSKDEWASQQRKRSNGYSVDDRIIQRQLEQMGVRRY